MIGGKTNVYISEYGTRSYVTIWGRYVHWQPHLMLSTNTWQLVSHIVQVASGKWQVVSKVTNFSL